MKKKLLFFLINLCVFISINLFAQPTVSFTASSVEACAPTNIVFTNTSSGCAGAATFAWDSGNGDVSNNENAVFTYSSGGDYTVSLTVSCDGFYVTETMEITIYDSPEAIFNVMSAETCMGEVVTFYSGMSLNASEYYWDFGDGTNSGWISEETTTHAYSTAGLMTVTLTVRDGNGCMHSTTDDIHVLGPEVAISADNTYGCNTLEVNFTDMSITNDPIAFILWEFGDGGTAFGSAVSHIYTEPGTYDVTVTVNTLSGCEVSQQFLDYITVGAVNSAFVAQDNAGCANEEMSFIATETNPSYTYTWNFGDGADELSSSTPTHSYSAGGVYDVSLEVNNNVGCVEESTYASYITIEDVSASFTVSDLPCYPVSPDIVHTINVIPASTSLTYSWDFGNGVISELEDPEILYTFPGNFTIELIVTTPNGCTATASNNLTVDGPWADVSISNDSVCTGEEVDFEITNLQNVDNSMWVVGGGDTYTSTSFTHTYDLAPPMGYYTSVLTLTSGTCEIDFQTDIYIFDIPEQVIVSGGGNQYGGQAELIATGGDNGVIYWQGTTNNGTSTEFESNTEIVYDNGTYYFRAANEIGCWGEQASASVVITDSIAIEITVNDASGPDVADGSIIVEIAGGTEPYTVTCNSAKSTHNFTELLPGDYTLNIEDALGNIESEVFAVGVLNSISTNEIVCGIYPNPAKNTLTIEFENNIPEYIKLYDILGQEVLSVKANSNCSVLDVSGFLSGIYVVELLVNGKLIIEKLIIE